MADRLPVDIAGRAVDDFGRAGRTTAPAGRLGKWLAGILERELEERRAVLWMPVLFGIGVLFYFGLPTEPPSIAVIVAALLPILAAVISRRQVWLLRLFVVLAVVAGGVAAMKIRTDVSPTPIIGSEYRGVLAGWIEEVERFGPREVRIVVRVVALEGLGKEETPHKVRITVRGAFEVAAVGTGIRGVVGLQAPAAPVFPGGYDFGRELFYENIGASGFSYGPPDVVNLGEPPFDLAWRIPIERVRADIGAKIETALPGDTGQIANALITGDRGGISEEMTEAYRVSGLAHILSISGLHMAIVAAFVFAVLRGGLALIPILALRYPIKKWAAGGTLVVATIYLLLSGADVAAQRSFIMLVVVMVAILVDRRALSLRNIAIAALVVLLLTPEAILTAGFQMSFVATLALIAGYEAVAEWRRSRLAVGPPPRRTLLRIALLFIAGLLLTSLLAGLATAPFGAYHFNRTQPLSLVANLAAAIPVTFIVMPAALFAVILMPLGWEGTPLQLMDLGLRMVNDIAVWTTAMTGRSGLVAASPPFALWLAAGGILWLCLWRERWRWLGVVAIVGGVLLAGTAQRPDVLIDDAGGAAMVRAPDGAYRFMGRGATFEAETWLRMDADPRLPTDPSLAAGVFCDPLGCTAPLDTGGRAALVVDPRALAEDCRRAAIVIVGATVTVPADCAAMVVTGHTLARLGVHALYRDPTSAAGFRISTARPETRRPWMSPLPQ